jgi:predicted esterase
VSPRSTAVRILLLLLLAPPVAFAQDDVAGVPAQDLTVADQPKQRYFLIGDTKAAPEPGFGLLVVLPGGDGSAEFHPFVKRIYANALPKGYLVAQLVAVPSASQRQIVWPSAKTKDPKQTFTTESFIANVVGEVKAKHKIDPARVFTLSWSSGGPAAYAASVSKDTPVTGSLVAMSVFPVQSLPPLAGAKGHKYYILHSPQDKTCPYFHTRMAKTGLTDAGAAVHVADYEGGHGWHGDIWGNIAAGIEWLETTKPPTTAPATAPSTRPVER